MIRRSYTGNETDNAGVEARTVGRLEWIWGIGSWDSDIRSGAYCGWREGGGLGIRGEEHVPD